MCSVTMQVCDNVLTIQRQIPFLLVDMLTASAATVMRRAVKFHGSNAESRDSFQVTSQPVTATYTHIHTYASHTCDLDRSIGSVVPLSIIGDQQS